MLNPVELSERVRLLKPVRRFAYNVAVAVGIVAAFWLSIVLGIGLAAALVVVLLESPLTLPDDLIALGLPVIIVFMFTLGLSGVNGGRGVVSGQDLPQTARRAVRSGLIVGLIAGAVFGVGWGLLINANPLLFAAVMALALALPLALFRVIACLIEPLSLRLLEGRRMSHGEIEHVR